MIPVGSVEVKPRRVDDVLVFVGRPQDVWREMLTVQEWKLFTADLFS